MSDGVFLLGMAAGFVFGSAYWLLMFAWWEKYR
jgi:hypothetical protein